MEQVLTSHLWILRRHPALLLSLRALHLSYSVKFIVAAAKEAYVYVLQPKPTTQTAPLNEQVLSHLLQAE